MLRIVLLISLLVSLGLMIRQFTVAPLPETQVPQVRPKARPLPAPAAEEAFGKQPVVRPLPDVYKGYLFTEERKLEDADFGEFGRGGQETPEGGASLEQVYYAGSLITGERRQGLITYREDNLGGRQADFSNPTLIRPRPGAEGVAPGEQKQVLVVGDRFRGYVVAAIEPDKIVFERGGEKIEKLLYDQSKKRLVATAMPKTPPGPGQAGGGVVMAPAQPPNPPPVTRLVPPGQAGASQAQVFRPTRSRRFPMGYPSAITPNVPAAPAPPATQNNQSQP